ncbi:MAG: FkbM family methyltransferase [Nocardioidaceae bacterium]
MRSLAGALRRVPLRVRAVRGGMDPVSASRLALGRPGALRLAGRRLDGPNPRVLGEVATEVAAGEYAAPGFEVRPGDRVIDVGANAGAFAVLAAAAGGSVLAFEPHPDTFRWLERNVAGLDVRPRRAAVVARPTSRGTARLWLEPGLDVSHHTAGAETGRALEVPAVTLEEALGDGCDLLKLDCEGEELALFDATAPDVLRRARRIVVEVHAYVGHPGPLLDALRRAGFVTDYRPKRGAPLGVAFAARR